MWPATLRDLVSASTAMASGGVSPDEVVVETTDTKRCGGGGDRGIDGEVPRHRRRFVGPGAGPSGKEVCSSIDGVKKFWPSYLVVRWQISHNKLNGFALLPQKDSFSL